MRCLVCSPDLGTGHARASECILASEFTFGLSGRPMSTRLSFIRGASMNEVVRTARPLAVEGASGKSAARQDRPLPSLMKNMTCIEDLRQVARRRVPRAFFGYAEAGSYSGATLRA